MVTQKKTIENKIMNDNSGILRQVLAFVALVLVALLLLVVVSRTSRTAIAQNHQAALSIAAELVDGSEDFSWQVPPPGFAERLRSYARLSDSWLLELEGYGYGGPFRLVAHYENDGTFTGMRVFEHHETPGFGTRIGRAWYGDIFAGEGSMSQPINQRMGQLSEAKFDAVIGASVSFRGVAKVLAAGSAAARKLNREKNKL